MIMGLKNFFKKISSTIGGFFKKIVVKVKDYSVNLFEKLKDFFLNKVLKFNYKIFFKTNWRLFLIIFILLFFIYLLIPKYSGSFSVCEGNVECTCLGYSYVKRKGPDVSYVKRCIGLPVLCKRLSEGKEDFCS